MSRVFFHNPGFLTSVQDRGRKKFRRYGVPESGCMDLISAGMANRILGNNDDDAVLEFTLTGPEFECSGDTCFAVTGPTTMVTIDGKQAAVNMPLNAKQGQRVSIAPLYRGARGYFAFQHGIMTSPVMGSRSWFPGIKDDGLIKKQDFIHVPPFITSSDKSASVRIADDWSYAKEVEVSAGPEWDMLTSIQQDMIQSSVFSIAENSRMGYILEAEPTLAHEHSILTVPVFPGIVQLTPGGKLIILMRDAQVTGGYPRIMVVHPFFLNVIAQKRKHENLVFRFT